MIVLFTSIFTLPVMSVIEDRKEGFLLSVLVAPVPRSAIVLGKVLGGTTLAAIQGMIFLAFAPLLVGVHITFVGFPADCSDHLSDLFFAHCLLGFASSPGSMWTPARLSTPSSIYFSSLSGCCRALGCFSVSGASGWLQFVMKMNPLTYGVEALRDLLPIPQAPGLTFSVPESLATLLLFTLVMFGLCFVMVNRRTTKPAA